MQLATAFNHIPLRDDSRSDMDSALSRWVQKIGVSGATDLVLSFLNGEFDSSTGSFLPIANDYTITACWVEYNGATTQVFFDGGSPSKTITAGAYDIQSDPVLASSFSVTEFTEGADIAVKFIMEVPSLGDSFPFHSLWRTYDGNQTIYFDRAQATVNGIDQVGESTITGTQQNRPSGYGPIILTSTGTGRALLGIGDAAIGGSGEIEARPGWFNRLVTAAFENNEAVAQLNMGVNGSKISLAKDPAYQHYFQYVNEAVIAYGTNDFAIAGDSTTPSALSADIESVVTALKSASVGNVTVMSTLPRSTSTDDWATIANQTALEAWDELTDAPIEFSKNLATHVANADQHVYVSSVRAPENEFMWLVNGTADYSTKDGTNPTPAGHALIATEMYPYLIDAQPVPNQAPTANAGNDFTGVNAIAAGASVVVGGADTDPDGTIATISWQVPAGKGTLSSTSVASPTYTAHSPSSDETVVLTKTVTDNDGATDSDTVTIEVEAASSGGGSGSGNPLRFATTRNYLMRIASQYDYTNYVSLFKFKVGGGALSSIALSFDASLLHSSSDGPLIDLSNGFTIDKVAVQLNGVSVPALFGGSRSKTMAGTDFDVLTDEIEASEFGLSTIPYGAEITVKVKLTKAESAEIPFSIFTASDVTDGLSMFYNEAGATVSDVDELGAFTYSGDTFTRQTGYHCRVMGRFVASNVRVLVGRGDSIMQGTGDSSSGEEGPGWFQRMTHKFDVVPPVLNAAIGGSKALAGASDPRIKALYAYATDGIIAYGTNDLASTGNSATAQEIRDRVLAIMANMREMGINTVGINHLSPRTTSTDNWATEENQVPMNNWGANGVADDFNQSAGALGADYIITVDSMRGNDYFKFAVDGTERFMVADNVHPSSHGHEVRAVEAYNIVATEFGLINAPENQPPTANAGPDQSVAAATQFTLDGTGSQDTDGTIVEWRWTQTAGDTVTLDLENQSSPRAISPSKTTPQTLTFSLVTVDDEGAVSSPSLVNIDVAAVVQNDVLNIIDKISFTFESDGMITAFPGRANRETFRLKPSDPTGLVLEDGWFDFEANDVRRVEISMLETTGVKIISSDTDSITRERSKLHVRMGDMPIKSSTKEFEPTVSVFVGDDERGVVMTAPGLSGAPKVKYYSTTARAV